MCNLNCVLCIAYAWNTVFFSRTDNAKRYRKNPLIYSFSLIFRATTLLISAHMSLRLLLRAFTTQAMSGTLPVSQLPGGIETEIKRSISRQGVAQEITRLTPPSGGLFLNKNGEKRDVRITDGICGQHGYVRKEIADTNTVRSRVWIAGIKSYLQDLTDACAKEEDRETKKEMKLELSTIRKAFVKSGTFPCAGCSYLMVKRLFLFLPIFIPIAFSHLFSFSFIRAADLHASNAPTKIKELCELLSLTPYKMNKLLFGEEVKAQLYPDTEVHSGKHSYIFFDFTRVTTHVVPFSSPHSCALSACSLLQVILFATMYKARSSL